MANMEASYNRRRRSRCPDDGTTHHQSIVQTRRRRGSHHIPLDKSPGPNRVKDQTLANMETFYNCRCRPRCPDDRTTRHQSIVQTR